MHHFTKNDTIALAPDSIKAIEADGKTAVNSCLGRACHGFLHHKNAPENVIHQALQDSPGCTFLMPRALSMRHVIPGHHAVMATRTGGDHAE